jgi:hypothetical protein
MERYPAISAPLASPHMDGGIGMEVIHDTMETLRHHVVRIHTRGANAIVDARSIAQNRLSHLCAPCNLARATISDAPASA